ncbi:MAG TPA: DnaJ C-terminal domain-containing protein [Actinomycetota bacterium]|nr:DnaJ C-terminal domain-containing protein [Actinomycetota bacterium]
MAQRDWVEKDYYKVLGVDSKASKDEIKRAYRKLAQRYHPDANAGDPDAEQRFKEISEAHAVLSNDDKRKEYDQVRSFVEAGGQRFYGFSPGAGTGGVRINIGDLFGSEGGVGDLFEDLFGFQGRRASRKGRDVETEARLSFEDAVNGATVTLPGGKRTRIPPGVRDGARIRVPRRGEPGPRGGEPGDLYVRVHVEPHPLFALGERGDVVVTVPLTYPEAALGAQVEVPTLDGTVTVKVPAGTSSGKTLRVKGRGAPRPKGGHGDLLVKVEIEVPRRLSRREKKLLEELAEARDDSPRAHLEAEIERRRASGARAAS